MIEDKTKTIDDILLEINPGEEYSASHVVKNGWTMWKTVLTFTMFLNSEEGKRLYKPVIFKQGAATRYKIRGSDIIDVLKLRQEGKLEINHESAE